MRFFIAQTIMDDNNIVAELRVQIMQAPEDVWRRIRSTLQVDTREQAIALAERDSVVAGKIRDILAGGEGSFLTRAPVVEQSFLTAPTATKNKKAGLQF